MQIFHNAAVYTGDDFTDAFAVEDGRFAAVSNGSDCPVQSTGDGSLC